MLTWFYYKKNYLSLDTEIQRLIGLVAPTLSRLQHHAWEKKHLTVRTKSCIFECCIINALLCGSETWTTYARHERKLNTFHMRNLRQILRISWSDRMTSETVLSRTECVSVMQSLKIRQLRWLGHLGRLPKAIPYSELSWVELAENRMAWRRQLHKDGRSIQTSMTEDILTHL